MVDETLNDPRKIPVDITMSVFDISESAEQSGMEMTEYLGVLMTVATMEALIDQQSRMQG